MLPPSLPEGTVALQRYVGSPSTLTNNNLPFLTVRDTDLLHLFRTHVVSVDYESLIIFIESLMKMLEVLLLLDHLRLEDDLLLPFGSGISERGHCG